MLDPILKEHRMLKLHDIRLLQLGEFHFYPLGLEILFLLIIRPITILEMLMLFKLPFFSTND